MEQFINWFIKKTNNKKSTGEAYYSSLANKLSKLVDKQLTSIEDPYKFIEIKEELEQNPVFIKDDETGNRQYSNALRHYLDYLIALSNNVIDLDTNNSVNDPTKEAIIKIRVGQGKFRKDLMKHWNSKCAVTGCDNKELLIASHIKPWSDSDGKEKLDPYNGLLLLSNIDKAFDSGLITFNDDGTIKISPQFNDCDKAFIHDNMTIELQEDHLSYLKYHQDNKFIK